MKAPSSSTVRLDWGSSGPSERWRRRQQRSERARESACKCQIGPMQQRAWAIALVPKMVSVSFQSFGNLLEWREPKSGRRQRQQRPGQGHHCVVQCSQGPRQRPPWHLGRTPRGKWPERQENHSQPQIGPTQASASQQPGERKQRPFCKNGSARLKFTLFHRK